MVPDVNSCRHPCHQCVVDVSNYDCVSNDNNDDKDDNNDNDHNDDDVVMTCSTCFMPMTVNDDNDVDYK